MRLSSCLAPLTGQFGDHWRFKCKNNVLGARRGLIARGVFRSLALANLDSFSATDLQPAACVFLTRAVLWSTALP
jgi:hypothetical protein